MFARSIAATCSRRLPLALLPPFTASYATKAKGSADVRRVTAAMPYKGRITRDEKGRRFIARDLPEPPRPGSNAFTFFCRAYFAEPDVKTNYMVGSVGSDYRRFTHDASLKWKSMTTEEREPYQKEAQKVRAKYEEAYAEYWKDTTEAQREVARHITGLRLNPPMGQEEKAEKAAKAKAEKAEKARAPRKAKASPTARSVPSSAGRKSGGYNVFIEEKMRGKGDPSEKKPTLKEVGEMWQRLDDRDRYRYTMIYEERQTQLTAGESVGDKEAAPARGRPSSKAQKAKEPESEKPNKDAARSEEEEEEEEN